MLRVFRGHRFCRLNHIEPLHLAQGARRHVRDLVLFVSWIVFYSYEWVDFGQPLTYGIAEEASAHRNRVSNSCLGLQVRRTG
ncbi:hypothetical protein D9M68_928640 [compost metagenome]